MILLNVTFLSFVDENFSCYAMFLLSCGAQVFISSLFSYPKKQLKPDNISVRLMSAQLEMNAKEPNVSSQVISRTLSRGAGPDWTEAVKIM